jgi:hypothetical protein
MGVDITSAAPGGVASLYRRAGCVDSVELAGFVVRKWSSLCSDPG